MRPLWDGPIDAQSTCVGSTISIIDQHGLIELDWAFATTCHKAQGSEWEKVLIIDEGWPNNRADVQRWRYTAATRARSKLVIMDKWNLR
jgi:ATP-dependent exoDNAse (exonuclease V) alpha subunit